MGKCVCICVSPARSRNCLATHAPTYALIAFLLSPPPPKRNLLLHFRGKRPWGTNGNAAVQRGGEEGKGLKNSSTRLIHPLPDLPAVVLCAPLLFFRSDFFRQNYLGARSFQKYTSLFFFFGGPLCAFSGRTAVSLCSHSLPPENFVNM